MFFYLIYFLDSRCVEATIKVFALRTERAFFIFIQNCGAKLQRKYETDKF